MNAGRLQKYSFQKENEHLFVLFYKSITVLKDTLFSLLLQATQEQSADVFFELIGIHRTAGSMPVVEPANGSEYRK